jgi:GNAT superfamily N-acetyltransferase
MHMDETEELIGICCRALVAQMADVPTIELHMARNCVLGLTGEPLADFNMLTIGPGPDAGAFLVRSIARAKERGLPLLATISPHVAEALASTASGLGMTPVGKAPLMVLRSSTQIRPDDRVNVTRALGPDLVRTAGDIAAAAFDCPRDAIARCIDVCITDAAGVEVHVASADGRPMSAVTVTPMGNTAGISLMGTLPEHQGKGIGGAMLKQVINDYRARGVQRFHLSATAAGLPLYESLGFEHVAELSAWLLLPPV